MKYKNGVFLFSILFVVACVPKGSVPPGDILPVKWFSDFAMTEQLKEMAPVHNQHDIQAMLNKRWYSPFKLINIKTKKVLNVNRCSQILPTITQLQPVHENEIYAYAELAAMCVATESIVKARPAIRSALSTFKLDADLPLHLPKNLALIISVSEWKEIAQNKDIVSWAQVEKVEFVSKISEYKAKYAMAGAYQEIALIARGDFNHDGIEDLLLFAKSHVVGGTYAAYRLFWVTKKNTNSRITLIREFPPDSQ